MKTYANLCTSDSSASLTVYASKKTHLKKNFRFFLHATSSPGLNAIAKLVKTGGAFALQLAFGVLLYWSMRQRQSARDPTARGYVQMFLRLFQQSTYRH